ncbi:MAG: hypothetical protein JKY42_08420 [Flavobacteriales bacterium]|nr:hypothetical protein [Flavobacteriales bacterium]
MLISNSYKNYVWFLTTLVEKGNSFIYFGGDNEITKDKNLYWDAHHARKTMGKYIFPTVFEGVELNREDFFGATIDMNNIEDLLAHIESDRKRFLNGE